MELCAVMLFIHIRMLYRVLSVSDFTVQVHNIWRWFCVDVLLALLGFHVKISIAPISYKSK
jgi:hypothetical protein